MLVPNYMQTWGLARAFGATVQWPLVEDCRPAAGAWTSIGWRRSCRRTRLIVICNPNNPTGARLRRTSSTPSAPSPTGTAPGCSRTRSTEARNWTVWKRRACGGAPRACSSRAACRRRMACPACASAGSPGPPTRSPRCGRTTTTPRLRRARSAIDWHARRWRRLDARGCSNARAASFAPTCRSSSSGWPRVASPGSAAGFSWIRPEAGAIVYVRYSHPVNSTELVTRLRETRSVLIVPGDHFGMDGYLRIGFGEPSPYLLEGLNRLRETLASLPSEQRAAAPTRMSEPDLTLALVGFGTRRPAFRPAARRDVRSPRVHVPHRGHRDPPSRQRRRSRRHRRRPGGGSGGVVAIARPPRSRADRAQRHRRHPLRRRRARDEAADGRVVVRRSHRARHRSGRGGRGARAGRARGPAARGHRQQGAGRLCVSRAGGAGRIRRSRLPVRGRGDGRGAGVQPGAGDAAGVTIDGFRGVINTTCNFILSELERGREFAEALAAMQARGIAEADPVARHRWLGRGGEDRGAGRTC